MILQDNSSPESLASVEYACAQQQDTDSEHHSPDVTGLGSKEKIHTPEACVPQCLIGNLVWLLYIRQRLIRSKTKYISRSFYSRNNAICPSCRYNVRKQKVWLSEKDLICYFLILSICGITIVSTATTCDVILKGMWFPVPNADESIRIKKKKSILFVAQTSGVMTYKLRGLN